MPNLLSYSKGGAGHRGVDTSIEGVKHVQPGLPKLQGLVLGAIADAGCNGLIGDEIAKRLDWEKFRVRPRTSELRIVGKIVDSGKRRKSEAGISSIVWILPEHLNIRQGTANA